MPKGKRLSAFLGHLINQFDSVICVKAIFHKNLPPEIIPDIQNLNAATERTNREHSITIAEKRRGQYFICNDSHGTSGATDAPPCDAIHGQSKRLMDVHTHPYGDKAIGIVPSGPDVFTTLEDSSRERRPQLSCITNHRTPLIGCYQNKKVPTKQKLDMYEQAAINQSYGDNSYLIDNFPKDFMTSFYRPDGKLVNRPHPSEVVDAAFGGATENLKTNVREFERSPFCLFIQHMTMPNDDRISMECRRRLSQPRDFWEF